MCGNGLLVAHWGRPGCIFSVSFIDADSLSLRRYGQDGVRLRRCGPFDEKKRGVNLGTKQIVDGPAVRLRHAARHRLVHQSLFVELQQCRALQRGQHEIPKGASTDVGDFMRHAKQLQGLKCHGPDRRTQQTTRSARCSFGSLTSSQAVSRHDHPQALQDA